MKIYNLRRTQKLPITRAQAWDFFSSPQNLSLITPQKMNFKIQSISGKGRMYAGQVISYKVTVLPFVRLRWVTEITHVSAPDYFVDEQRFGPYALWHHKHHFEDTEGGTLMTDEVDYALPFGILGRLVHAAFVRAEVNAIFDYRYRVLENYFQTGIKSELV